MKLVGYADKLSVERSEEITFMVSSEDGDYSASVVRLIHGDANPAGPGFKSEEVESALAGAYAGKAQAIRSGSFVRVDPARTLDLHDDFTLQMWIRPTMPDKPLQCLMSKRGLNNSGWSLRLEHGRLAVSLGDQSVRIGEQVRRDQWYFVAAVFEASTGRTRVILEPSSGVVVRHGGVAEGTLQPSLSLGARPLLIGAEEIYREDGPRTTHFFNGKIDSPRVFRAALTDGDLSVLREGASGERRAAILAAWDFSADISGWTVTDVSGNEHHGTTVNKPMRGATGWNWTGSETAWPKAADQYGAIHFHDDDLADAGWDPSFRLRIPKDWRSGLYAVRLHAGQHEDYVPFVVTPRLGEARAKIALVLPAFSYLAYANEQMLNAGGLLAGRDPAYPAQAQDAYVIANGLRGLYDRHTDGSGVCYSSLLRPLVNMRPQYAAPWLNSGSGSPHQLNADLHIIDWLEHSGYSYDVVTDFEQHRDGHRRLAEYEVVLTGSHHEYWSGEMIDAAQTYLRSAGRLINLAGNGMYWVTQLDPDTGTSIEIRRRGPSTRNWEPEPGEAHLSSTGELGGIWRYRGRAPQTWLGVGYTAEGISRGRPYERQADSFDATAAFVFEGIAEDEVIGDFPCLVNGWGAAGFEVDRADHALGTPHHTLVLATATQFTDDFQAGIEEVMVADSAQGGSVSPLVRCDMTLLEYPGGGAVFSTGSISWSGCLSYNEYDNNVSRITRNVLDRFASHPLDSMSRDSSVSQTA